MRAHLESVYEQTGNAPAELDNSPPSPAVAYLWDYFQQLNHARQFGMSPNPLLYGEIQAWAQLMHIPLRVWEVETLKQLDLLWLNAQASNEK